MWPLSWALSPCIGPSWATLEHSIMAIVQTASFYDFRNAFERMGRDNQFSRDGLAGLYEYLDQLSEDTGEPIELDVIAICCDYNEDSFLDVARNYDIDLSECEDDDEIRETVLDYLNDETMVAWSDDNSVVYAAF
jgi:hypothetical protein